MGPPLHLAWLQMLGMLRQVFSEARDQLLVLPQPKSGVVPHMAVLMVASRGPATAEPSPGQAHSNTEAPVPPNSGSMGRRATGGEARRWPVSTRSTPGLRRWKPAALSLLSQLREVRHPPLRGAQDALRGPAVPRAVCQ